MSKRTATSSLNQYNWDQEDEPEEPGVFQTASSEVLQSRVIRTAKRRIRTSDSDTKPQQSPFSGFAGFGKASFTSASNPPPFSFLNQVKITKDNDDNQKMKNGTQLENSICANIKDTGQHGNSSYSNTSSKPQDGDEHDKKCSNLELLRDLNLSCCNWIAEHLKKNPYCILTPIFKDYKKHLDELNLDDRHIGQNAVGNQSNLDSDKRPEHSELEILKNSKVEVDKHNLSKDAVDSSQEKNDTEVSITKFKFGTFQPIKPFNHQPGENTTLGMGPSTFTLNNIAAKPTNLDDDSKNNDEEEPEEPPKDEFTPVVEEGSIFDIKCKVFVKKDGSYISRGVGTLFLKPVKDTNKIQAVVRAHTSLGNILLNILLAPGTPIQKTGKNNVMIVCIPTPESQPPPVPVLIRVKTSEECDALIKKLDTCCKDS